MDLENQSNIQLDNELDAQSWDIFVKTPIPTHENIEWNIHELKPKKQKKFLYFLLWVLVGLLLSFWLNLFQNNRLLSNTISGTLNTLSNRINAVGNTISNVIIDHSKLSWTYATDNSQYVIDFNKDWTLRWTEKYIGWGIFWDRTSFFVWTYKYENNVYTLYVEWWMMALNTVFTATPQSDWSLRIVGWSVHNELFRKKS